MKVKELVKILEDWAPLSLQETYDNSGLIIGNLESTITKALISLDCTEQVVNEAIENKCNIIISHHPIIFSPIKKITGNSYVEKTIIKAIKNDISIYALHTPLDNISSGVNNKICEKLGLKNLSILSPKNDILKKLVLYIPEAHFNEVSNAIFSIGVGNIGNYSYCGFSSLGTGSFKGNNKSNPRIGNKNNIEKVEELRFETIFPSYLQNKLIKTIEITHPYEEPAFDIYSMSIESNNLGSGMYGELEKEVEIEDFLKNLKKVFNLTFIKYSEYNHKIKKVAVCGGSGSFLRNYIPSDIDAFITSDIKYHEWFDPENKYCMIDIGHYESEQYTSELIVEYLKKNTLYLQTLKSKVNTNPVKYIS